MAALSFRRNGFGHQIEEAMGCIRGGRRESEDMPLASALADMEESDEIHRQIGLRYAFE